MRHPSAAYLELGKIYKVGGVMLAAKRGYGETVGFERSPPEKRNHAAFNPPEHNSPDNLARTDNALAEMDTRLCGYDEAS